MNTLHRSLLARICVAAAILSMLGACSSVSQATKDSVARADTRFEQAKQALGSSEGGAVELQRASDHLQQAKEAVNSPRGPRAEEGGAPILFGTNGPRMVRLMAQFGDAWNTKSAAPAKAIP